MPTAPTPRPARRRAPHQPARRPRRSSAALLAWALLAVIVAGGQLARWAGGAPGAFSPPDQPPTRRKAEVETGTVVRSPAPVVTPTTALPSAGDAREPRLRRPPRDRDARRRQARRPAREPKRPFAGLRRPSIAFTSPLIAPRLALPRILAPRLDAVRGLVTRAQPGQPVVVSISAYCLRGRTRRGNVVRTGIVAADPRVFPLARHIELYAAGRYLGRYLVDDTGAAIRGARIDVWTPDCSDARRFGRREGIAALVAAGD